jgi:hypothetical protein
MIGKTTPSPIAPNPTRVAIWSRDPDGSEIFISATSALNCAMRSGWVSIVTELRKVEERWS